MPKARHGLIERERRTVSWTIRLLGEVPAPLAIGSVFAGCVAAVTPALSVWAIQQLANGAGRGGSIYALVLVSMVFGFTSVLQQVNFALARRLALRVNSYAADLLDQRLAGAEPIEFLQHERMKEVMEARQCVTEGKVSTAVQGLVNIMLALVSAVSLVWSLWSISPGGAVVATFAVVPVLVTYGWYGRQESRLWPAAAEHSRRAAYLDEQLAHPRTAIELLSAGGSRMLARAAHQARVESTAIRERLENLSILSDSAAGMGSSFCLFIALLLFWNGSNGSAVDMAAGIVGIVSGMSAMSGLGYQVGELATSIPAVTRFRLLVCIGPVKHAVLGCSADPSLVVDSLAAEAVFVKYPGGTDTVIDGVDLEVASGRMTALVGGNGAGKTTLVRAMSGILPPSSGICRLKLSDGSFVAPGSLWVSTLEQDYGRYELTIRQYLELGIASPVAEEILWVALSQVQLDDYVHRLPNGLDTQMGSSWGGSDLSGGQWQKLALARLFLMDRAVWILDEPTSALDAEAEAEVFKLLKSMGRDRCILVVTHRASTLTHVDDIAVMDHGQVVQRGCFAELVSQDGRFRDMFQNQLEEVRRLVGVDSLIPANSINVFPGNGGGGVGEDGYSKFRV